MPTGGTTEQEILERFPAFLMPFFRKEGRRWQVLGTRYQHIKTTCKTALHGWRSGVYRNAVHARKMKVLKKLKKIWNNRCATSHPQRQIG